MFPFVVYACFVLSSLTFPVKGSTFLPKSSNAYELTAIPSVPVMYIGDPSSS